jgi:hypothetical protein
MQTGGAMTDAVLLAPADQRRGLARRHRPIAWLSAHLRARRIDLELAKGVATWRSPTHAARALQLTTRRHRRGLAVGVTRLVADAERPVGNFRLTSAIPPCREQVREAAPVIIAIASRLCDGDPVDARGVATLRLVITDGVGPCYARIHRKALTDALEGVLLWLDAYDWPLRCSAWTDQTL